MIREKFAAKSNQDSKAANFGINTEANWLNATNSKLNFRRQYVVKGQLKKTTD